MDGPANEKERRCLASLLLNGALPVESWQIGRFNVCLHACPLRLTGPPPQIRALLFAKTVRIAGLSYFDALPIRELYDALDALLSDDEKRQLASIWQAFAIRHDKALNWYRALCPDMQEVAHAPTLAPKDPHRKEKDAGVIVPSVAAAIAEYKRQERELEALRSNRGGTSGA